MHTSCVRTWRSHLHLTSVNSCVNSPETQWNSESNLKQVQVYFNKCAFQHERWRSQAKRSVLGQSQFRMSTFTLVTGCSHCVHTDTGLKECKVCFSYTSTLWKAAQVLGRLGAVDNNMMTRGQGSLGLEISTVGTAAKTLAMFEFQWPQP